jgi:putative peptide zinc metalloprotease protein
MPTPPGNLNPGGVGSTLRRPSAERNPAPGVPTPRTAPSGTPPAPAQGIEMIGSFEGSGHKNAPGLVRRPDGQVVQLTPLLYAVLSCIDGHRRADQIAAAAGELTGRLVSDADIDFLIDTKLRPLGLVKGSDGSEPELRKANPLLGLKLRMVISNPRVTRALATPFARLFSTPLVVAGSLAFFVLINWLLFERGLGGAVREAIYQPHLLLLVFGLTTISAAFHELGHAAALVRGGGTPGVMGAGLYLVWPAFYTDVTDAYRLDRRARLRVDLGGLYFNALFALAAFALWAVTGWEALLAVIPLQVLQMVRQLIPLVRFDGYHVLADLTGVPDLFAHIKPILLGLLPTRWGRPENKVLKPRVRVVVTLWVLMVVPLLALTLFVMVFTLPRILATAWDSLVLQTEEVTAAWSSGEIASAAVHSLAALAIAIPVLSIGYLLIRLVRRVTIRTWRATEGRPVRRAIAIVVAACLLAVLTSAWWPDGQYTPIEARERGRLADVLSLKPFIDPGAAAEASSASITQPQDLANGATTTHDITSADEQQVAAEAGEEGVIEPDSAFRFALPGAPGEGDNQALAANYSSGTALVAMAVSLIFSDGGEVTNSNEAYALASCVECVAAAIAFQLIIVLDEANLIVPENTAAAITAFCTRCATMAIATQIIVALNEPLSPEAQAELEQLWLELETLQGQANEMPLDELLAGLADLEAQIRGVLEEEGAVFLDPTDEGEEPLAESTTPSPEPSTTGEPTPTPSSTTEPSPTPTEDPSPSPTTSTEPSPSPTPSSTP